MAGKAFIFLLILTEALGLCLIALMLTLLLGYTGGLSLDVQNGGMFNLHPILMTIGFVFLYGNAILTFKVAGFVGVDRFMRKMFHFAIQAVAFVVVVLGAFVAFRYNAVHGYPQMPSVHSWIGMATLVMFGLQLLFGFLFFLYPRPREFIRSAYKAVHVFFGFFIFAMVAVSVISGLTEFIMLKGGFDEWTPAVYIADFFSITLMAYIGFVTFTITCAGPRITENEPNHTEEEGAALMESKQ